MRHSTLAWSLLLASNLSLAVDEAEIPDADFLEFLGLWETEQGEWISPAEVAEIQLGEAVDVESEQENAKEVVDEE